MELPVYILIGLVAMLLAGLEARRYDDEGSCLIVGVKIVVVFVYGALWPFGILYSVLYHLTKTKKKDALKQGE